MKKPSKRITPSKLDLRRVRGGIDTVPLPEMPALRLQPVSFTGLQSINRCAIDTVPLPE